MATTDEALIEPGSGTANRARSVLRSEKYAAIWRFAVVGVANTALSYVVFRLVLRGMDGRRAAAAIASGLGYVAGGALSFGLNRSWTFRSSGRVRAQFGRFVVSQALLLVGNSALVTFGVSHLRLPVTPWWVAATAMTVVANFAVQRLWVYR